MTPFERYWQEVPVKVKKKTAADIWKRKHLDDKVEIIIADIENRKRADDRWLRGYIPDPPVYLRQERWNDEIIRPRNAHLTAPNAHVAFQPSLSSATPATPVDRVGGRRHISELLKLVRRA